MTPLTRFLPPTSFNFVVRTGLLCCHGDKRLVLFSVGTNAYTYFPLHREILNKLFYFLNALFIYLFFKKSLASMCEDVVVIAMALQHLRLDRLGMETSRALLKMNK